MARSLSYSFDALTPVEVPSNALVWTSLQYYDGAGWAALPERGKLDMKPTRWADNRLLFLDPVEGLAKEFQTVQSGNFDVKCWTKGDCSLGVEGDQRVFIKAPFLAEVAVHVLRDRLPAMPKTWKPLIFLLNASAATFRISENLCLIITRDEKHKVNISEVDYNGGFACAHPATDTAIASGSFAVPTFASLNNCYIMPQLPNAAGPWGYFIQFFPWGFLFLPKIVELSKPQIVVGAVGLGKKVETIGMVFHPPKLWIEVKLDLPSKSCRTLELGKDFLLTAKKVDETDIDVFLIIDGQLAKANYSFDLRVNKPGKPMHRATLYFKCNHKPTVPVRVKNSSAGTAAAAGTAAEQQRYQLVASKSCTVLQQQGSPIGIDKDQLVSDQTIASLDAEISMYYTHPPALKLCNAFTTVANPCED